MSWGSSSTEIPQWDFLIMCCWSLHHRTLFYGHEVRKTFKENHTRKKRKEKKKKTTTKQKKPQTSHIENTVICNISSSLMSKIINIILEGKTNIKCQ